MTSAILIALVGLMYFTVAIDQEIARLKSLRCSGCALDYESAAGRAAGAGVGLETPPTEAKDNA